MKLKILDNIFCFIAELLFLIQINSSGSTSHHERADAIMANSSVLSLWLFLSVTDAIRQVDLHLTVGGKYIVIMQGDV